MRRNQQNIDPVVGIVLGFIAGLITVFVLSSFPIFANYTVIGLINLFVVTGVMLWRLPQLRANANSYNQPSTQNYHYVKFTRYVDRKPRPTTVQISIEKWRELVSLTHSEATAERLIEDLVTGYPGQKASWYCDKAIRDLERDRM